MKKGMPKEVKLHQGMTGKGRLSGTPTGGHKGSGSVNKGATRGSTARTPKTLGGRVA